MGRHPYLVPKCRWKGMRDLPKVAQLIPKLEASASSYLPDCIQSSFGKKGKRQSNRVHEAVERGGSSFLPKGWAAGGKGAFPPDQEVRSLTVRPGHVPLQSYCKAFWTVALVSQTTGMGVCWEIARWNILLLILSQYNYHYKRSRKGIRASHLILRMNKHSAGQIQGLALVYVTLALFWASLGDWLVPPSEEPGFFFNYCPQDCSNGLLPDSPPTALEWSWPTLGELLISSGWSEGGRLLLRFKRKNFPCLSNFPIKCWCEALKCGFLVEHRKAGPAKSGLCKADVTTRTITQQFHADVNVRYFFSISFSNLSWN